MIEQRKFQVGDVVYVKSNDYDGALVGPFTIEKQHNGNGNLYVNGEQFSVWGSRCSGSSWVSRSSLLLNGSDDLARARQEHRRKLARDVLVEDIDAVEKAIIAMRVALGQEVHK